MRNLRYVVVLLIALSIIASFAPGIGTPSAAAPSAAVDVLRVPGGGYWGHPSPFGYNRGPGFMRASMVFDTLVWRDASGETIPWLAEAWTVSEDNLTYTFTLRDGVQWHDGEPLSADDVVFSIEYYLANPGTAWFMSQVDQIASLQALDEHRVEITLKQPYASFLQINAEALLIFPQHIWETVEDPRAYTAPEAFIGTGAYRVIDYSAAEGTYLFEANPDFFLGMPYVRRLEFLPTNDNLLALLNGDIAAFDQFGGITDEMLLPFDRDPFEIRTAPGEWGMFLYFNLAADTPLQDVRVRQAIAHAIDRQALLERVLFDFGDVGSMGVLPPSNPFYADDLVDYDHDLDQARALLEAAGYDGSPIQLSYSTDWIMASPRVVEIVVNGLEAVGINVEEVVMDQASMDAAAVEGNYEMSVVGFGGLGGDPDLLRRYYFTESLVQGFSRALGYSNPEFDTLAVSQVTMTDMDQRVQAVHQMQAILAADLPVLPLYYTARVVVFNTNVFDNWYFTPGGWGGGIPMPYNKHQFIVGHPTGLDIRQ